MHSRDQFLKKFNSVLTESPGVAVIHSDLSNFRANNKEFIWSILYTFKMLVDDGWTLLFPAFTFSFCSGKPYSYSKSKSETGILADKVLEIFSGAKRTASPIYSFVTLGNPPNSIIEDSGKTTFGVNSVFEWLEKQNAHVVMFGCEWSYCTQFHRYEEILSVPYRKFKIFEGSADYGVGPINVKTSMFVRSLEYNPINDFSPIVKELESNDLIKKTVLLGAPVQSTRVKDIKDLCLRQIECDPFIYLSNKNEVMKKITENSERSRQEKLTVSIFSSKNIELFEKYLLQFLNKLIPDRTTHIIHIPFGQMYKSLIDQSSNVWESPPLIKIYIDRLRDIPGYDFHNKSKVIEAVRQYAKIIKEFHQCSNGWSLVHFFTQDSPSRAASHIFQDKKLISECNDILFSELKGDNQILFVDTFSEIACYDGSPFDPRLEFIGKFSFSDGFSEHLARKWVSLIIAMFGKDVRLIVVDLDNTLWGGILGEEGIDGLQLGGDYPGNAFKAFQAELLEHQKRGVAIGVASKNDTDLVLRSISQMQDMLIREQNIQVHRINWEPKWKNIVNMAAELNLGLSSVMFIDDNPVEREAVKRNLPDVKILPLSNDPAEYVSILRSSPFLQPIEITSEDLGRLSDFSVNRERNVLKRKAMSLDDYYVSLDISLIFSDISPSNSSRAAQLCQKTNQFNTTSRRYNQKQLYSLKKAGHEVLIVNYSDKFSPSENIGLIVIKYYGTKEAVIDLYLLSCRVLGRGIEAAIPNIVANIVASKGIERLMAEIIETERNTPARNVYKEAGFEKFDSGNMWNLDITKKKIPHWIKYSLQNEV